MVNNKEKKGAADAKEERLSCLSKDITLAAREGGGSVEMNPALRLAVKKLNHLICLQQILIEPLKKVQGITWNQIR